jgi:hypothetical protein
MKTFLLLVTAVSTLVSFWALVHVANNRNYRAERDQLDQKKARVEEIQQQLYRSPSRALKLQLVGARNHLLANERVLNETDMNQFLLIVCGIGGILLLLRLQKKVD